MQQYAQYTNVAKAKRHGIELELDYMTKWFDLGASYEHIRIYDSATQENIIDYADKLKIKAVYKPSDKFDVGVSWKYWFKPNYSAPNYTTSYATYDWLDEAYSQVDLKATYRDPDIMEGLIINVGVNNFFNSRHLNPSAAIRNDDYEPTAIGKGRNFYADFEIKF